MHSKLHAGLYELGSRALLQLLNSRYARALFTPASKVWLRHARLQQWLERASFDAIIDGGASVGEFAAIARQALPTVPLLCIEPHPPSARTLERRGFQVVEAALWHSTGTRTLQQPTDAVTSCTVVVDDTTPAARHWTVRTVRLEDLPVHGRNVLVKLDLQGAELEALRGMGALWQRCGALLLEVSYGPQGSYEPLRALLAEHGFVEAATFNELDGPQAVLEADKLFVREGP